ncbi:MAG: hypothetical protein QOJ89_2355, partial [bacterium]
LSAAAAAGVGCVLAQLRRAAPAVSAPVAPAELTAQRRTIYEALVGAVVAEAPLRLDPACASSAAAQFAGVYATWPVDARGRADGVLEELEWGPYPVAFSRLPRAARASFLRDCMRVVGEDPSSAERGRLALVAGALELVGVTVGPGEDSGRELVSV